MISRLLFLLKLTTSEVTKMLKKFVQYSTGVSLLVLLWSCGSQQSSTFSAKRYLAYDKSEFAKQSCDVNRDPQTWGVIIGINDYVDEGISDLKGSVADAWIFYHYLTSPGGGAVPAKQLKLLLNKEASRTEVEGAIGNFLGQSCPQDKIIIYFAGHGAPEPGHEDNAFLLMHDTKLDNMVGSAISMQRLPEFLNWRAESVGNLLLVVDACHSGNISFPQHRGVKKPPNVAAKERSKGIEKSLKSLATDQKGKNWSVISAAASNQYAGELKGECGNGVEYTGGLFTCHLLEALKGHSDVNQDGNLSINEVYGYVRDKVSKETMGMQTPIFSGTEDMTKPFFKVPKSKKTIEIPVLPEVYLVQNYRSAYTPTRWTSLGLLLTAGIVSATFTNDANNLTREVNTFNYRTRTQDEFYQLNTERNSAFDNANMSFALTGLFGVTSLLVSLLEFYDEPQNRQEVYKIKPWFTLPVNNTSTQSSLGVEVSF
jgi:hypothetical protein